MSDVPEFQSFGKIPRLFRHIVLTEKLDGTNAQVIVTEDFDVYAGSRTRMITPVDDNHGFAAWVEENEDDLRILGPGRHFGEWWGNGINRGYGLKNGDKRFSLFNTKRWDKEAGDGGRPACCSVVPTIYEGPFDTELVKTFVEDLKVNGSWAVPGYMNPEGIVIYHSAGNLLFKVTVEGDDKAKSEV